MKRKLTGPDHPIHVPMIRPPKTAENAANSWGNNVLGGTILDSVDPIDGFLTGCGSSEPPIGGYDCDMLIVQSFGWNTTSMHYNWWRNFKKTHKSGWISLKSKSLKK